MRFARLPVYHFDGRTNMEIETRDFGTLDIDEQEIIEFKRPIYGFDEYTKFVLLCDPEIGEHFTWLQSIEQPHLCFILVDPTVVPVTYSIEVPQEAVELLGEGDFVCWNIAVIPEDFKNATVNLKSPILINPQTHQAAQVILEQDYPIRAPMMHPSEEELEIC